MEESEKEKIKLTTKEILLGLLDMVVEGINIADAYGYHRDYIKNYKNWRKLDKKQFHNALYRLKQQGYLEKYKKEKKIILKLTPIGQEKALQYLSAKLQIKEPQRWDKKWRMVIFDIPENKKVLREALRQRLNQAGFYLLQKSVFVHPFECKELVFALKYGYNIGKYLQYVIAENIETELDLVSHFYKKRILKEKHL